MQSGETKVACYTAAIPDLPNGTKGRISIYRMDGSESTPDEILELDEASTICTAGNLDPVAFPMWGFMKGEWLRIEFTKEGQKKAVAQTIFVPEPLMISDEKGHKISLRICDLSFEHFFLRLEGCQPGEKIQLISSSCDELIRYPEEVYEAGYASIILAAVIGELGGPASIRVRGEDSDLTLGYFWGDQAIKMRVSEPSNH